MLLWKRNYRFHFHASLLLQVKSFNLYQNRVCVNHITGVICVSLGPVRQEVTAHLLLQALCESGIRVDLCLSYLHDSIEGGVCPNTQIGAGYIVTYGGRHHTHGYAKLLIGSASLKQLQQTLKRLKRQHMDMC